MILQFTISSSYIVQTECFSFVYKRKYKGRIEKSNSDPTLRTQEHRKINPSCVN